MTIGKISPYVLGQTFVINPKHPKNAGQKLIYNKVCDLVKEYHTPAVFNNKCIKISNVVPRAMLQKLNELGIFFQREI